MAGITRRSITVGIRLPITVAREFAKLAEERGMKPTNAGRVALQEWIWKNREK